MDFAGTRIDRRAVCVAVGFVDVIRGPRAFGERERGGEVKKIAAILEELFGGEELRHRPRSGQVLPLPSRPERTQAKHFGYHRMCPRAREPRLSRWVLDQQAAARGANLTAQLLGRTEIVELLARKAATVFEFQRHAHRADRAGSSGLWRGCRSCSRAAAERW